MHILLDRLKLYIWKSILNYYPRRIYQMDLIKSGRQTIKLAMVLMLLLFYSVYSYAQPVYPCTDPLSCPGGCHEDGVTCWDIDDPVPLDSGLLFLVGTAVTFGLYKLNLRRQQA